MHPKTPIIIFCLNMGFYDLVKCMIDYVVF